LGEEQRPGRGEGSKPSGGREFLTSVAMTGKAQKWENLSKNWGEEDAWYTKRQGEGFRQKGRKKEENAQWREKLRGGTEQKNHKNSLDEKKSDGKAP